MTTWCGITPAAEEETWEKPGGAEVSFDDLDEGLQSVIGADFLGYFIKAVDIPGAVGSNVDDPTAFNGTCRKALSTDSSGEMLSGPTQNNISANIYWVTFRLKISSNTSESTIGTISVKVTRGGGSTSVSSRDIKPIDFTSPGVWQSFSMVAELRNNDTGLNVYVTFTSGIADLSIDTIRLWPLGQVSTELIENLSVTNAKIANLHGEKIIASTIDTDSIKAGAVIPEKTSQGIAWSFVGDITGDGTSNRHISLGYKAYLVQYMRIEPLIWMLSCLSPLGSLVHKASETIYIYSVPTFIYMYPHNWSEIVKLHSSDGFVIDDVANLDGISYRYVAFCGP